MIILRKCGGVSKSVWKNADMFSGKGFVSCDQADEMAKLPIKKLLYGNAICEARSLFSVRLCDTCCCRGGLMQIHDMTLLVSKTNYGGSCEGWYRGVETALQGGYAALAK